MSLMTNEQTVRIRSESMAPGADGFIHYCSSHTAEIDHQLNESGAIRFRGWDVDSAALFKTVVEYINSTTMSYVDGNSPRTKLSSGVYTSTEYPKELFISLHNELSYAREWPTRMLWCCVQPASAGGETPIADGAAILQNL